MYYQSPSFGELFVALLLGAAIGALFSDRFRPFRKYVAAAIGVIFLIVAFKIHIPGVPQLLFFAIGLIGALKLLADKLKANTGFDRVYGDAQWADLEHLQQNGLLEPVNTVEARQ